MKQISVIQNIFTFVKNIIMAAPENKIIINPEICNGKPVIRGFRITVTTILEYLAAGETVENILTAYPMLKNDDITACLEYARKISDKSILSHELQR
jgi:uncharacterized protein (DUF433 family)